MGKVFIISGNIGAGKSTAIHMLKEDFGNSFVFIDEFDNKTDYDKFILKQIYQDNIVNRDILQTYANCDRYLKTMYAIEKSKEKNVVIDRGWIDALVFSYVHNFYRNELGETINFYLPKLKEIVQNKEIVYIHFKTDLDDCLKNIAKRNRNHEYGDRMLFVAKNFDNWLKNKYLYYNIKYHVVRNYGELLNLIEKES